MEALSRMMEKVVEVRYLSDFTVATQTIIYLMVSHLLFVDVLIFSLRRTWIRFCIWGVFIWFEDVSGLKVNLGKLELIPVRDVHNLEELTNLMGCKASHIPMKYPGLPLGAKFTANTLWNTILDKMERRLAWWKRLYLSEGRRITLIKSTLSNLPTYFLALFSYPSKCVTSHWKVKTRFFMERFRWGV